VGCRNPSLATAQDTNLIGWMLPAGQFSSRARSELRTKNFFFSLLAHRGDLRPYVLGPQRNRSVIAQHNHARPNNLVSRTCRKRVRAVLMPHVESVSNLAMGCFCLCLFGHLRNRHTQLVSIN